MTGQPRYVVWNLMFIGFEACLIGWAHFVVGVSWAAIGTAFAAVIALGAVLFTYTVKVHVPRQQRRHQAVLASYQAAAGSQRSQHHRLPQALPGRREVVDSQSTPYLPSTPVTAQSIAQASRAH